MLHGIAVYDMYDKVHLIEWVIETIILFCILSLYTTKFGIDIRTKIKIKKLKKEIEKTNNEYTQYLFTKNTIRNYRKRKNGKCKRCDNKIYKGDNYCRECGVKLKNK